MPRPPGTAGTGPGPASKAAVPSPARRPGTPGRAQPSRAARLALAGDRGCLAGWCAGWRVNHIVRDRIVMILIIFPLLPSAPCTPQVSSQTPVIRGEPGIGRTALLDYVTTLAADFRIERVVGIESE